jgi:hypothetical protein
VPAEATIPNPEDASPPPITAVQATSRSFGSGTTRTEVDVPLDGPVAAGDLVIVVVGWYDVAVTVQSVSDGANAYELAVTTQTGAARPIIQSIYYAAAAAGGASTVKVTFSAPADEPDIRIAEYSGLDPAHPFELATGAIDGGAIASVGAITTTFPRELLVAAGMTYTSEYTGAGSGFSRRVVSDQGSLLEDRIVDAPGTWSADAPVQPTPEWLMQLAAFH